MLQPHSGDKESQVSRKVTISRSVVSCKCESDIPLFLCSIRFPSHFVSPRHVDWAHPQNWTGEVHSMRLTHQLVCGAMVRPQG